MYKPRYMGETYEGDKESIRPLTTCKLLFRAFICPVGIKLTAGQVSQLHGGVAVENPEPDSKLRVLELSKSTKISAFFFSLLSLFLASLLSSFYASFHLFFSFLPFSLLSNPLFFPTPFFSFFFIYLQFSRILFALYSLHLITERIKLLNLIYHVKK